jgi:glycosyltransferase involved in cell wall biosynthesis
MGSPSKLAWEQTVLPRLAKREQVGALLCPGNIAPLRPTVPTIVALRNAAPFCPRAGQDGGVRNWIHDHTLRALMCASARRASRIIFISQYFRDLIAHEVPSVADRSDIIYNGRDALTFEQPTDAFLDQHGIRRPYILSVGHLQPYKRFPLLVEAFAQIAHDPPARERQLVLAGRPANAIALHAIEWMIRAHKLEDRVILTGAVPHASVGSLIAGCEFFIFQSTCENCPNTLIEAMAGGVPIACSNMGPMPEIAGDAVLFYDPNDRHSIAGAILRMASDASLRSDLSKRSEKRALFFPTWHEVSRSVLRSMEAAAVSRASATP